MYRCLLDTTMKYMCIDYYISGDSNQKYHKGDFNIASKEEKEQVKKKTKKVISNVPMGLQYWPKTNPYSYTMHWLGGEGCGYLKANVQ